MASSKLDISKKQRPKTVVFNYTDEYISLYKVGIYPFAKMPTGVRVFFFRANKEKKVVCSVYLEQDFTPDLASDLLGDVQYKRFIDSICSIALKALAKKGVIVEEDFDVHITSGKLTYK